MYLTKTPVPPKSAQADYILIVYAAFSSTFMVATILYSKHDYFVRGFYAAFIVIII